MNFKNLEKTLGLKFKNKSLLIQALTHRSTKPEEIEKFYGYNERLEFFGDAILKLVITEFLFHQFPEFSEGQLTKIRSNLISDQTLAKIAREINLGEFLFMGKREIEAKEYNLPSVLSTSLEALFAAIYLDKGYSRAKKIILKLIENKIKNAIDFEKTSDYKSRLQEEVQKLGWKLPVYNVIRETGPEHKKTFYVEATVGDGSVFFKGVGRGRTKKSAEQFSAKNVLEKFLKSEIKKVE